MAGWNHRLNGHEIEQVWGDGEGQGRLVCCCPWGHKELDMTEQLNHSNSLCSPLLSLPYFSSQLWLASPLSFSPVCSVSISPSFPACLSDSVWWAGLRTTQPGDVPTAATSLLLTLVFLDTKAEPFQGRLSPGSWVSFGIFQESVLPPSIDLRWNSVINPWGTLVELGRGEQQKGREDSGHSPSRPWAWTKDAPSPEAVGGEGAGPWHRHMWKLSVAKLMGPVFFSRRNNGEEHFGVWEARDQVLAPLLCPWLQDLGQMSEPLWPSLLSCLK